MHPTQNHSQPSAQPAALDAALAGLRVLNTRYSALVSDARDARADKADRTGVAWRVGQVFVHKLYGYRGVIAGWDRACARGVPWAASVHARPDQPFYHVLPDEDDCRAAFGAPRLSK